jgi:DNA-binding transcriptional MerR regulator
MRGTMRVRELAKHLGVSGDWIRKLERLGRIPAATRDQNGHRRYSLDDVARVRAALFGRTGDMGHSRHGNSPPDSDLEESR